MKYYSISIVAAGLLLADAARSQNDGVLFKFPPSAQNQTKAVQAVPLNERVVTQGPVISWDWSMPKRYGPDVDVNNNGIVDLPNSREYVMNLEDPINGNNGCPLHNSQAQFKISLDASASRPLTLVTKPISGVDKSASELVSVNEIPAEAPVFRWFIELESGGTRESFSTKQTLCLPEGHHKVTVEMRQNAQVGHALNTAKRSWVSRSQRYISVVDHLIVLMGDSFAAGEGAPEKIADLQIAFEEGQKAWKQMRFGFKINDNSAQAGDYLFSFHNGARLPAEWADDGGPITTQINEYKVYERIADSANVFNANSLVKKVSSLAEVGRYQLRETNVGALDKSRPYFHHRRSHRSSFTHASQFAIQLEDASDKSSVTFVNLAQSGATVDVGMVGAYAGSANDYTVLTPSVFLGQDKLMPAQFDTLDAILGRPGVDVGTRAIDEMYMSIGGNDAGFANIIATLMTAWGWSEQDRGQILHAFMTGNWNNFVTMGADIIQAATLWKNPRDLPGAGGLHAAYDKVQVQLMRLRGTGRLRGDVNLILPPFFGTTDATANVNRTDSVSELASVHEKGLLYCQADINPDAFKGVPILSSLTEIEPKEFAYVRRNVYPFLVEMMASYRHSDNAPQWKFIRPAQDGYDGQPARNGLCGRTKGTGPNYKPRHGDDLLGVHLETEVGQRWYRSPQEGAGLQTGGITQNMGMFHPTERGYAWMAWRIMQERSPFEIEFKNGSFVDQNDSITEATLLSQSAEIPITLADAYDVSLFAIPLGKGHRINVSELSRVGRTLDITVFDEQGNALASTEASRSPLGDGSNTFLDGGFFSKNTATATINKGISSNMLDGIDLTGIVVKQWGTPLPALTTVSPEVVSTAYNQTIDDFNFTAGSNQKVYLAISDASNDRFEILSGTGDNFGATVNMATSALFKIDIQR